MTLPPCFDSEEQYEAYMESLEANAPREATYCWDCTPQYQKDMLEEGRCRHPEVKFEVIKTQWDEGLQGLRPLTSRRITTLTTRSGR